MQRDTYNLLLEIYSPARLDSRLARQVAHSMYYVYILKSENFSKTYVGLTRKIERRLEEHNEGKSTYTKRYAPWSLVYSEEFTTRQEARSREKYFKSAAGRKYMKKNIIPR